MVSRDGFTQITSHPMLQELLRMLRHHRWLRAVQLVSSQTRDDSGPRRGYDARLIFQSDNLAEQPLELYASELMAFSLTPGDWATVSEGTWAKGICTLVLGDGEVSCRQLSYRLFEGDREPEERSSIH